MSHEKQVEIPLDSDIKLAGVLHMPEEQALAAVLICHGMLSFKDSPKHRGLAVRLADQGIAALRFDFQGRGESPGDLMELSFTRQVVEAQSAMTFLRRESGARRFGVVGSSMGGAVAVLLAAKGVEGLKALVTFACVGRPAGLGPRMVGQDELDAWRERGWLDMEGERVGYAWYEDAQRTDVVKAAAGVPQPWLILHGEQDEVVPATEASALHAAAPNSDLRIMPKADHRFSAEHDLEAILQQALRWLRDHLRP